MTSVSPTAIRVARPRIYLAMAQDAALICLFSVFGVIYVEQALEGKLSAAPFALEQALIVGIFLTRRRSQVTSTRPLDWIAATIGGFLPLTFQPAASSHAGLLWAGTSVQMVGLTFTSVAFLYLGRSFGVVAANRGLKVNGPYRLVRHPIYLTHLVTMLGFLIANFAPLNLVLFAVTMVCQVLRMRAEERVLIDSSDYALYKARVRWRLIPGLY